VFEIGSSLRRAREHQKLDLSQVERATRIRAKYLQALEEERFEILPGTAKGFLRTYADFLGLDAQRFVDEYNTHFAPSEVLEAAPPVRVRRPRRLIGARLVVIPIAVAVAVFIWRATSGDHQTALRPPPSHERVSTVAPPRPPARRHQPREARIALVAARGACWLSVRLGSEAGKVVYERTLERGRTARFAGTHLWIRLGAPWNVDATLNRKRAQLPSAIGNVVVTPSALQIVSG
jgi:transcriptional regulator with XRE-family HTH domain